MLDAFPLRAQPSGLVAVFIRLAGAGAAAPTVPMGPKGEPSSTSSSPGVTTARSGAGAYTITFPERPGKLVHWLQPGYGNATGGVGTGVPKSASIDADSMATGSVLSLTVHAIDTGVAADLAAGENLCLTLFFKQTGSGV